MMDYQSNVASGLTSAEVAQRRRQWGANIIDRPKKLGPVWALLKKFTSPLLLLLIAVSVISFFLRERLNAIIILVMVAVSAAVDFINTYRSEQAVKKLIAKVVTYVTVRRDQRWQTGAASELVPGDVVELMAGKVVPADGVVLDQHDLFINQSALTGESFPVEKTAALAADLPNLKYGRPLESGRPDAVLMGTSVVTGYATMLVVTTGRATEFGRIAQRLSAAEPATSFDKGIKAFSFFNLRLTSVMVLVVFLGNTLLGRNVIDSFIFSLAIAIGLTPELLPVMMSIGLSRGSVRMAAKNVVVKQLRAIQNLGAMNVLCTDKTGTLTEDQITVVKCVDAFGQPADEVFWYAYLNSHFHTGVKYPLDTAIQHYRQPDLKAYQKIDELPFDFERKRDSVVVAGRGQYLMATKGAPEGVLAVAATYQQANGQVAAFDQAVRQTAEQQYHNLSAEGFRVLAVARREIDAPRRVFTINDERHLIFLGFIAFLDPPKATATEAINGLESFGVAIKILTGDSEVLTNTICRQIDLPVAGMLTGAELAKMNDQALDKVVGQTTVFARVDPEQKERIILALKRVGQVVGYLGAGINDAPALRAADVGISVNNAVDVAKETADIILLRKSLRVLRDGVVEGRKTFQNALKYLMMGLSSNFGNMFSMMGASFFLPWLPMRPPQVLLNNFLYDASQLTLPSDRVDDGSVAKPLRWDMSFIKKFTLVFGPISSIFDLMTFGLLLLVFKLPEAGFQTGWFMESLATQVLVIYVIRTKLWSFIQSRPSKWVIINTVAAVAVGWALPLVSLGAVWHFTPLPPVILLAIIGLVVVYLLLVELVKHWFYKKYSPAP